MAHRIRQLEEALAILQSNFTTEPHALLTEGLHLEYSDPGVSGDPANDINDATDAFGTLTIGDSGEGKYFGPSAGSEVRSQVPTS